MVQRAVARFQYAVERVGLCLSAWIAVKDHTGFRAQLVKRFTDDSGDDLVRNQLARIHHSLGLEADWRTSLHRRA